MEHKSKTEYNKSVTFYTEIINALNADFSLYKSIINAVEPASLLEIGCGMGRLFPIYLDRVKEIYGFDISDGMIHSAKLKFPTINLTVSDMLTFEISKKFDLIVVSNSLLKHLKNNNDRLLAIRKMKEHLSVNGIIIFDHSSYLYYESATTVWIDAGNSVIADWIPNSDGILSGFQWKKEVSSEIDKVFWRHVNNGKTTFEIEYTAFVYKVDELKNHIKSNDLFFEQILTDYKINGITNKGKRFIAIAGQDEELLRTYKLKFQKEFLELCK
jgi:2-polyprenyl-3-methyl-5-hydroxy-6-metoxy-1,4-benzoquinol methylase